MLVRVANDTINMKQGENCVKRPETENIVFYMFYVCVSSVETHRTIYQTNELFIDDRLRPILPSLLVD